MAAHDDETTVGIFQPVTLKGGNQAVMPLLRRKTTNSDELFHRGPDRTEEKLFIREHDRIRVKHNLFQ